MTGSNPSAAREPTRFLRRRWRLRIRGFLLLIAIAGTWLGIEANSAHRQAKFAAAVLGAGGHVYYDYQYPIGGDKFGWRSRLSRLVGDDYVYSVCEVSLADSPRDALACLGELPSSLRALDLSGSDVVDDDLSGLVKLDKLEELDLSATRITDAGLTFIGKIGGLRRLRICDPATTYDPTAPGNTQERYARFCTHEPHISDAGLRKLGSLSKLEHLDLQGNDISAAGAMHLKRLDRLKGLNLRGTNVSDAGVADLKAAIPSLEIDRYFPPHSTSEDSEWATLPDEVVRQIRREANP